MKLLEQGKKKQKKSAFLKRGVTETDKNVTFTFANPKNIALNGNAEDRWLQFDVLVRANVSGTYLSNMTFSLEYQTNRFFAKSVSNNHIVAEKAGIFDTSSYDEPNLSDAANDRIRFQLGEVFNPGDPFEVLNLVEVPTSFTKVMEVRMEIRGNQNTVDLDFNNVGFMDINTFFSSPTNADPLNFAFYDNSIHITALNLPFQPSPIITSITNTATPAGNGTRVVITGNHFGEPNFPPLTK